ncbi:MAG: DUF3786 domain-containing protein [Desulfobacteraceae bacterium]|nr:DUF3786 domain-containing protein [Desulfobacteraceae bacterium]
MARIDDFQQARDLAAQELASQNIHDLARRAGFEVVAEKSLRVSFLGRIYRISFPDFLFSDDGDATAAVPLQEQVLILHYLQKCQPELKGRWVAYREIPGAGFYFGAFVKRAIDPLKKVFGKNAALLKQAAAKLSAAPIDTGNAGFRLDILPYAPIQIILWEGDDEFAPEANILFDASVGEYLSPEDAAWLASLPVYRLMALAR